MPGVTPGTAGRGEKRRGVSRSVASGQNTTGKTVSVLPGGAAMFNPVFTEFLADLTK